MQDHTRKKKIQQKLSILSKYQQIFPTSTQWGRIQYLLQISYSNVSVSLKKMYSIANSNNETKFMNRNSNKTIIDCVVVQDQMKGAEDFMTACQKGFKNMIQIEFGQLQLDKLQKQTQDYYQVMIARAAVGKTFIYPIKNVTDNVPYEQKPQQMDQDFDSLFLYDQNSIPKQFKQNYIIYESSQKCLPIYIVHFGIDHNKYKELQEKIICEVCEDNVAKMYCQTEDSYICVACDKTHHHNRLGYKHKRTELAQKTKVAGNCSVHTSLRLELFCVDCNRPLCINCKIKGDHSEGQFLMHPLIRISQRYNETAGLLRQVDTHLDKKKKTLMNSITSTQLKLKDINRKSTEVQQKIYQMMHKALKQLQVITKKKMSMLMSDHIELKRQLDQVQWIQKFVKYEYEVLSPNDFLLSWGRHMNLRKDAISDAFQPSKILPDMRIQGNVNISTEEQARKKANFKRPQEYQLGKSAIFKKAQDKTTNLLKSKIENVNIKQQQEDERQTIKSKNNLLNLSILKHL